MSNSGLYFQREWRLSLKRNGLTYLEYTSIGINHNEVEPHRLVFNCSPYAQQGESSSLTISIYNMTTQDANLIQENDDIFLEAGYVERGAGVIYTGKVYSFFGSRVQDGNDFNYVYTIYSLAYSGNGGVYTSNSQALPQSIDISEYQVDAPFTVGNQALKIGRIFGYSPSSSQIQPSVKNQIATNMIVSGKNMNLLLADFSSKTNVAMNLDPINKTYMLLDKNLNKQTFIEFSKQIEPVIVDNNHGLIGFPLFDATTQTISFARNMDNDLTLLTSKVQVDLSNAQLVNASNGLTQDLVTAYRQYNTFIVYSVTYYGDTRGSGADWIQKVMAWGL